MKRRLVLLVVMLVPVFLAGCDLLQTLGINEPPIAVIDASPASGPAPLAASFSGIMSRDDGTIVDYRWDFGDPHDAGVASGSAATHTYTLPGTYLAKLTVTDNSGQVTVERVAIVVTEAPPVATIAVTNDTPPAGDAVLFDAAASAAPTGSLSAYQWDFGDGTTATGVNASHVYTEPGYYVVTLTVTDSRGAVCTERCAVFVQEGTPGGGGTCSDPDTSCGGGGDRPLAVISGLPSCSGILVGQTMKLDAGYSRAAEGKLIRYDWDFGDGSTTSGIEVTHIYTSAGRYGVTLTVTDDSGTKQSASGLVYVGQSCGL